MNDSIRQKLSVLAERYEEVGRLLSDPETIAAKERFRELSREYARLEAVARDFGAFTKLESELAAADELADSADPDMRELGREEAETLREQLEAREQDLLLHLVPKDPDDDANLFLEIRAGTGGDEAALFAGDLFRMYSRYAEEQGWKVEVLSASEGEHGGF
ncbi:MAG: PCRF domain-containing protein, partial [Gammaproteobacteria bacterium]|nr:PCRF domain-containing protein [Gammaproteobacteria bacterium]